jgi:O-methyltransferase
MTIKDDLKKILPTPLLSLIYRLRSYNLVQGNLTYRQDGLATAHNADFMREPRFASAYEAGKAVGVWQNADIHWRAYVACWAAAKGAALEGDFVECGVYRGSISRMVMDYVGFRRMPDRKFYLLDTFSGLVEKYISDEEKRQGRRAGVYEETFEAVRSTFADIPNVEIIRGTVPDTLPEVRSQKVCYLSLDMNCAEPELAAAEYFWPRLSSGAVIVLDDYGFAGHHEQKKAMDGFAASVGVEVLSLPTGQGLIFKP